MGDLTEETPKPMLPVEGRPILEHILTGLRESGIQEFCLITGWKAEVIESHFGDGSAFGVQIHYVRQEVQDGTGKAPELAKAFVGDAPFLLTYGDILVKPETYRQMLARWEGGNLSGLVTVTGSEDVTKGGLFFFDGEFFLQHLVEKPSAAQLDELRAAGWLKTGEPAWYNAGIYCFNWRALANVLPELSTDNDQGELYLTDTVAMLAKAMHLEVADADEVNGINNRRQLAQCEALLQQRLRHHWMDEGVTFIDPESCTLSEGCSFGQDVVIEPQTHFRGDCVIGDNCRIGPGSLVENASLGANVNVVHSVVREANVGNDVAIGPFAHLRPAADVGDGCRIGNFVEVKKSQLGAGTKVNHLSYIGDANLGDNVNVGAGTITANYDGVNKHRTVIGSNSKTGANSVLVAPVNVGEQATIGAGSTITKDVADGALAIGRARQMTKEGWAERKV